jgi:DNA-binding MarR family transcriptional regulator
MAISSSTPTTAQERTGAMSQAVGPDEVPTRPRGRVAAGTHPTELQRLALQELTHPDCDPLVVQAVIWLFRAYNATLNVQADTLRTVGLSPSGFNVLMALVNTPGNELEPCQLAERLLVSRPSMTGLLDTLQRKDLIVRRRHEVDGRRVVVGLTPTARTLLADHFPVHYAQEQKLFAGFAPDEIEQLVQLLRRIPGAAPEHLRTPDDLHVTG